MCHCKQMSVQRIPSSGVTWLFEGIEEELIQLSSVGHLVACIASAIHDDQLVWKSALLEISGVPNGAT